MPEKPEPSPYAATADTYMSVPHEVVSWVWLTRLPTKCHGDFRSDTVVQVHVCTLAFW